MNASFDYSRWSDAELARAKLTAEQFLTQNQNEISSVLSRQRRILDILLALLQRRDLSLEERLDCFARIAETAESMRECANGFFELGAQPLVARTVETGSLY
jgi:broad specificity phosphatase PhoE